MSSLHVLDALSKSWTRRDVNLTPALIGCTLSAVFLLISYEISFSVPVIDDYSRAGDTATIGLLRSMRAEYIGWSGRFFSTTLESALNYFIYINHFYSFVIVTLWIVSIYFIYLAINAIFDVRRGVALAIAVVLEMERWCLLTGPQESFFWLTGAVENYLSVSVFIFLWASTLRLQAECRTPSVAVIGALAVGSFLAAGLHELYAAVFVVSLALVTGAVSIQIRSIKMWPLIILGAAVLGLAIVVAAPGNVVRASFFPKEFDRVTAVLLAAQYHLPKVATISNFVVVLAGVVLFSVQRRIAVNARVSDILSGPWIAIFASGFVIAMFSTPVAIMAAIPFRTVDGIIFFALVASYLCVGLVFHREPNLHRRQPPLPMLIRSSLAAFFCIGVFSASNIRLAFEDDFYISPMFRQQYAARLQCLQAVNGQSDAHVELAPFTKRPQMTFADDISTDPKHSTNVGLAKYYGIADVRLGEMNSVFFGRRTSRESDERGRTCAFNPV